jgi:hypothetical protein|tara:strand:- start:1055 stop:1768 length:714 start_codon:yes stop_codon:yes gene_type:complete
MANGKPKDPYSQEYEKLSGGDVGSQWLERMREQEGQIDWMQKAAESLSGIPEKGRKAFDASKKDVLANLASEQYRRRRTPIGAALTAAEQRRRDAQRQFGAQEADMAKQALQEKAVADMAQAKVYETRIGMGTEHEKGIEHLTTLGPMVESWKADYDDDLWGADEDAFFNSAANYARENLPPHLRRSFMEMHVMAQYKDWGGWRGNPFDKSDSANLGGAVPSGSSTYEEISAPPVEG